MIGRLHSLIERVVAGGMDAAVFQTWTTPRTWVAGELVTAALLNTHIRDNENALRSGGLALSSQAANDFIYASSSTQFGRLAAVDGKIAKYTTAGGWGMAGAGNNPYVVTLTQVLNTASEVAILTFDVPAGEWADGDMIFVWMSALNKNNKGSDGTITVKVNAGAGAQVTIPIANSNIFVNNANEFPAMGFVCVLQRVGADVWVCDQSMGILPTSGGVAYGAFASASNPTRLSPVSTPTNFTTLFTVSVKVTLSAADATFYIKPQRSRVWRQSN